MPNKNIVCIFPEQILPIFLVFWPLLFVPASYYCIRFSIVHFFAVFGRTVIFFSSFYSLKLHHIRELMLAKNLSKSKSICKRLSHSASIFIFYFYFSIHSPNILYSIFLLERVDSFWSKHRFNRLHQQKWKKRE